MLEGLAHSPLPAVVGLDDELRVLDKENHAGRHAAFLRSWLSLTEFGKAILAHKEDFSRHNPIDSLMGRHEADQRSDMAFRSCSDETSTETRMTRLILTADSSAAGALMGAHPGDLAIAIERRLIWGALLSGVQLDAFFAARTTQENGLHWQDDSPSWRLEEFGVADLGLIELCTKCEAVELWINPEPNAQLMLLWLLDYLRPHANVTSRLALVQADFSIGNQLPRELAALRPQAVPVRNDHLEIAASAWAAWRAPTPQAWFDLLARDLKTFLHLRNTVISLLEELPMRGSGLGATEMRILELISAGHVHPYEVFPGHEKSNERRVFGYWEVGALLDGLAHGPAPAVLGLDEGPFDLDMHEDAGRHARYKRSRLALTELGKAIIARADDFSWHNPIHRWWGGTEVVVREER
ncbi:hypothetical protein [Bradyrhizobium sp. AZCC 2289]|uniref:hypothetical protein n=1 Tax=Bradyrhizobium sp. AZCC 2289 TaxID=3117026 RepID=UPI002FF3D18F